MSDQPPGYEGEGDSVEAAIAAACAQAGLDPDAVAVQVLSPGRLAAAVPGEHLSGNQARVRVAPLPQLAVTARRHLERLLALLEVEAEVRANPPSSGAAAPTVILDVEGMDLGILIGWRGESLRALQTVVNLMLGDAGLAGDAPRVVIDIAGYRHRREQAVAQLALRTAATVTRIGRPIALEPMPAYERRAVHLALAGDSRVTTSSQGLDSERRVTIAPTPGEAAP
ncbi:MAG: protein jag [Candidatus Dormibacteria bacterium]